MILPAMLILGAVLMFSVSFRIKVYVPLKGVPTAFTSYVKYLIQFFVYLNIYPHAVNVLVCEILMLLILVHI